MRIENQDEALAFLRAELARRDGGEPGLAETHISLVLLGRSVVFKLKKAVRQPYLDFATAERRLDMCERELQLNRRTAPGLYRAVHRLVRGVDGRLTLDGEGDLVDAVLEMARFDETQLFDRMARRDALSSPLIARLATIVARFHATARPVSEATTSGSERVGTVLAINEAGLEAARPLFGDASVDAATRAMRALWQQHGLLLDQRQHNGRVRRCHGDLHLRNIVEIDGEPVLFDCLEFNEEMATIDILYDLAFVVMDLWHRGLRPLANLLFNRYLDAGIATDGDEAAGLPLMPLFMAMRATVRAHVTAAQALQGGRDAGALAAEARAYLDLARRLATPARPRLVAIGGYSGSGKSTTAAAAAHMVGPAPGARILSSDRIRKALFGIAPETRLPDEAYRPEVSEKIYAMQREEAGRILAAGHGVIADAVFGKEEERDAIEAVAREHGAGFSGIWLEAPARTLVERVEARRGDPSDATVEVVRSQLRRDPGPLGGWQRTDTGDGLAAQRVAGLLAAQG